MKLISDDYKTQNRLLHESNKKYGERGHRHLNKVIELKSKYNCVTVCDYGSGKGLLSKHANFPVQNYDPAIPEYSKEPNPSDLVVCTDVMEHVQPKYLTNVMAHLQGLTKNVIYLCIATRPDTSKTLPDGSNPHKIIKDAVFWIRIFSGDYNIVDTEIKEGEVYITGEAI